MGLAAAAGAVAALHTSRSASARCRLWPALAALQGTLGALPPSRSLCLGAHTALPAGGGGGYGVLPCAGHAAELPRRDGSDCGCAHAPWGRAGMCGSSSSSSKRNLQGGQQGSRLLTPTLPLSPPPPCLASHRRLVPPRHAGLALCGRPRRDCGGGGCVRFAGGLGQGAGWGHGDGWHCCLGLGTGRAPQRCSRVRPRPHLPAVLQWAAGSSVLPWSLTSSASCGSCRRVGVGQQGCWGGPGWAWTLRPAHVVSGCGMHACLAAWCTQLCA